MSIRMHLYEKKVLFLLPISLSNLMVSPPTDTQTLERTIDTFSNQFQQQQIFFQIFTSVFLGSISSQCHLFTEIRYHFSNLRLHTQLKTVISCWKFLRHKQGSVHTFSKVHNPLPTLAATLIIKCASLVIHFIHSFPSRFFNFGTLKLLQKIMDQGVTRELTSIKDGGL